MPGARHSQARHVRLSRKCPGEGCPADPSRTGDQVREARRGARVSLREGPGIRLRAGTRPPALDPLGRRRPPWLDARRLQASRRQAKDGKVAVIQLHGVPDTAHSWVNTPTPLFESYIKYLADNGYRVIALRDLARFVDPSIVPSKPLAGDRGPQGPANLRTWATKSLRAGPSVMGMRPLKLMRSEAGHTAMTTLVKIGDEAQPRLPGVLLGEAVSPSQSGRENTVGSHPLCLRLSRVRISRGERSTIRLRQSNSLVFTSISVGVLSPMLFFAPRATRREGREPTRINRGANLPGARCEADREWRRCRRGSKNRRRR